MRKKLTKEERRKKLLGLLGGAADLEGVNKLVTDLRKEIIKAFTETSATFTTRS